MPTISPFLWFDTQAEEAAKFYASTFRNSTVGKVARYDEAGAKVSGQPAGSVMTVDMEIIGQRFTLLNGGPIFTFNPSISFFINFDPSHQNDAKSNIDEVWKKLVDGGKALMELGEYPFSKRYGWVQDKYGVSWQLILTNPEGEDRPDVIPSFLFVKDMCGKAEEAINFYTSVFKDPFDSAQGKSKKGAMMKYPKGHEPDKEGTIMFADFKLLGTWFAAMDSAHEHKFSFNEAISFVINCDTQKEIDYYWGKLSAVPESEQCGWLKDTFGISWQVVPTAMGEMMTDKDPKKVRRTMEAMLAMKKLDIEKLQEAYEGK